MERHAFLYSYRQEAFEAEMQVAVVFKSPLPGLEPNILNIKIQPTKESICSSISRSRESRTIPSRRRWTSARACLQINQMNTPEAYERLIGACILGNRAWFSSGTRSRPVNYVDTIRKMYAERGLFAYPYPAGAMGLWRQTACLKNMVMRGLTNPCAGDIMLDK
ncbi:MAG: hypothetical protein ACLVJO_11040 [[Clostridium] scindens]